MPLLAQLSLTRARLLLGCVLLLNLAAASCQSPSDAQAQSESKLKLSLGLFSPITGTPYLHAPGNVSDVEEGFFERIESSYDKKRGQVRNYLFFNPADLANQWLLPHSNFLFVQMIELPLRLPEKDDKPCDKEKEPPKPTRLLYYELVKANTNGNKVFDEGDRKTIAISEVSGSGYQELIKDVDWTLHRMMTSEDELLIIYRAEGKHFAARLSLSKRQITETKELAPLPQIQPLS
jgi:hypothetical protein